MNANIPSEEAQLKFQNAGYFHPFYTPQEILTLGAFGGSFFFKLASRSLIPPEFFSTLASELWSKSQPNEEINFFEVAAPPLKGNIEINIMTKAKDPLGWFQWYTKFFYGTHNPDTVPDRVYQWEYNIKIHCQIIENTPYEGELDRWLDLEFCKPNKQMLLQLSWDPTKRYFKNGRPFPPS